MSIHNDFKNNSGKPRGNHACVREISGVKWGGGKSTIFWGPQKLGKNNQNWQIFSYFFFPTPQKHHFPDTFPSSFLFFQSLNDSPRMISRNMDTY